MPTLTESHLVISDSPNAFLGLPQTFSAHISEGSLYPGMDTSAPGCKSMQEVTPLAHMTLIGIPVDLTPREPRPQVLQYRPKVSISFSNKIKWERLFDNLRPPVIVQEVPTPPLNDDHLPSHTLAVGWIQQSTGLSDSELGALTGVSRISIQNWKSSKNIGRKQEACLLQVEDILKRAQRNHRSREQLYTWLVTPNPIDAVTPFSLIEQGEFDRVRMLAILSESKIPPTPAWAKKAKQSPLDHPLERHEQPGDVFADEE